jgi:hypothetical protein
MSTLPQDCLDDCPPVDAEIADGTVFRIVRGTELQSGDFVTAEEAGKWLRNDSCQRKGLSVFRNKDEAGVHADNFQRLGRFIAIGTLVADHGWTKLTAGRQPSHTTWWPTAEMDRRTPFGSVEAVP